MAKKAAKKTTGTKTAGKKSPAKKSPTKKPTAKKPATVAGYLKAVPAERRAALEAVRAVILKNLDPKIEEGIQYGMIGYMVPHAVYPDGYHCDPSQPLPFASLASQKNHMSLSFFSLYCDAAEMERFKKAWAATGKKLDMGASCVRFKKIDDVPLDVVGKTVKRMTAAKFIRAYEAGFGAKAKKKAATKKTAAKKASRKKAGGAA